MSPKTTAIVGKRRIELSNLDKILFPDDAIVKAEVIEYYVKVAPAMLRHIKGRPLSLLRFPDGVRGEKFFQKSRPDWAPDWMPHIRLDKTDYMMAAEEAALVFLANLASIEFHQMQIRPDISPDPDCMVFDLDPPEGLAFNRIIDLAFRLREFIESRGYHVFVKTTGNKGLHLVIPLQPAASCDTVFDEARSLAATFVEKNPDTTLHIKKEDRKGRLLLDIYRNRNGQTIVAAYSLRGNPGAPVSFPLTWDELAGLSSSRDYTLHNAPEELARRGDVWEAMYAYSSPLGGRMRPRRKGADRGKGSTPEQGMPVGSLASYEKKRRFSQTPEPPPILAEGSSNMYVVHRHHASQLHYDLRLEQAGVLQSWAVPKGLPPTPGIKRLAIQTEDHPLSYLDFAGIIPKGQYGAGKMWVFSRGRYEITKQKKDGFYFRLNSEELTAEYRLIHTRAKEWLLERVDAAVFPASMEPMLALSMDAPPAGDFLYEVKWDGIRAILFLHEGELRIHSRNGRDITEQFPELQTPDLLRASSAVLDGEIVCLDAEGRPVFHNVIRRLQQTGTGIDRMRRQHAAVCYLFDCLYLDGRSLLKDPLALRRDWLEDSIREGGAFRFSQSVEDGLALFEAAAKAGLEGIMAKDKNSPYLPGKRSSRWIKVKSRHTADCLIVGFSAIKARGDSLGALLLAVRANGGLRYAGRVGTGFDDRTRNSLFKSLEKGRTKRPPPHIDIPREDARDAVWVDPVAWCEIEYSSITEDERFREPVFLRMRPDLD